MWILGMVAQCARWWSPRAAGCFAAADTAVAAMRGCIRLRNSSGVRWTLRSRAFSRGPSHKTSQKSARNPGTRQGV
ncbi:hypothetical protein B0H14DRAFT_2938233 [Mycena olivaceomarginata]|nr:hypothetical protein B0H14DRAFT_2938233 [Mycena olivaceomarginata]